MEEIKTPTLGNAQHHLTEFSQTTFTDLQHDFHELNHEISKDSPLENFRHEYAKLFNILQKSMTNQARYIEKCRVLESEIVGNKAKVKTVAKLSEEDSRTISNLSDEKDKKQAILNESKELLRVAIEENQKMNSIIAELENRLEECVAAERSRKDYLKQLMNRRAELKKENDELSNQIPQYQDSNEKLQNKLEQKDREIENSINELRKIEDMVSSRRLEEQRERQNLMNLERDRDATKVRLSEARQKVKDRTCDVNTKQEEQRQLNRKVIELKRRIEASKTEKQDMNERYTKLQKDLDALLDVTSSIEKEVKDNNDILEKKVQETDNLKAQCKKKEDERDFIEERKSSLSEQFADLRKETDSVRQMINQSQEIIDSLRRDCEFTRKQIDASHREENNKIKKNETEKQKISKAEVFLQMYRNQALNIDAEVLIIKTHLHETQKKIFNIEKEKEKYSDELSQATSQYLLSQDIIRDIDEKIAAKNNEIIEAEKKVRQKQTLYEQVRSEREIASKKVKEVRVEIDNLELEFQRMRNAINQHKDDIRRIGDEKLRDKRNIDKILEEDQRLREKLAEVQIKTATSQRAVSSHEGEICKLERAIKDAEVQLGIEGRKLEEVKRERDQMCNQNVLRENEIREIGQKLEILRNQCRRGEKEYTLREQDISRLREQLEADQEKLSHLSQLDVTLREKRDDIHRLQKELLQLKAERAAMEDELAVPINIHRWTLLESSDPVRFEKLKRYQELQAELAERTKQVDLFQEKIKEEEAKYLDLCAIIRKKPGAEVQQSAAEYANKCKSEKYTLEQITQQLESYRDVVKEYRKELSEAQTQLLEERNKWINQKKRDIKKRQQLQEMEPIIQELGLTDADGIFTSTK